MFCRPLAIFIIPDDCKLFPPRYSSCNLVLWDKTAAMSSAASSHMLLLDIPNFVKFKTFCKPFIIFRAPSDHKSFPPSCSFSSLVLLDKTVAISSAASSPMLLLGILNTVRFEMLCNILTNFVIPTDCKLFPPRYSSCNLVL